MLAQKLHLVVLPGLDGTGLLLDRFVAAFTGVGHAEVVAYPVDKVLDYEGLANFVRMRLPQDRPYFLLAESFSGPLGIMLAAEGLPGLRGLILSCTFARAPVPVPAVLQPLLCALPLRRLPLRWVSTLTFGARATPHGRALLAQSLAQVSPAVFAARLQALLSVNVVPLLGRLRLPVLYLGAAQDRLVAARFAEEMASHVPNFSKEILCAPHFLLQTLPTEAARCVASFARKYV